MGGKKNEEKYYLFMNPSSLKKVMILKRKKTLDSVMEELKHEEERTKVCFPFQAGYSSLNLKYYLINK